MLSNDQIRAVFKAIPIPCLILKTDTPHYTIAEVNEAYLQATHSSNRDLIGQQLFDAFPESPDKLNTAGISNLRGSLKQVLSTGLPHTMDMQRYDIPVRNTDEFEEKYWEPRNIPVHNSRGEIDCILHIVKDVTDQVISRHQYEQSQGLLEALTNQSETPMFVRDKEGRYFFTNRKFQQVFGTVDEQVSDKQDAEHTDPEDDYQLLQNQSPVVTEEAVNTPEGTRHFITNRFPLSNLPGLEQAVGGIATDITRRKQAEYEKERALNRLQKSNRKQACLYNISSLQEQEITIDELLAQAAEYLPDGLEHTSAAEVRIEYAGRTYSTDGYTSSDQSLKIQTEEIGESPLLIEVVYTGQIPDDDEGPFPERERRLIQTVARQLALKLDHIKTREELDRKSQLLNRAYKLARIGIWELDVVNSSLYWSGTVKELHEVDPDFEPSLESAISFYKEEYREVISQAVQNAIETGEPFDLEMEIVTAGGNDLWVRAVGEAEFKDGKCLRVFGSTQNIQKRKEAEEALRLSEQRFRSLVQDGSDLIAILDPEANYKYVSPTSRSILGIPADDLIGTNALDYIHEADRPRIAETLADLPNSKRVHIPAFRFRDAEGNWRWIETVATNMMDDPAVGGIVANSRDMSEHMEREAQLQNSLDRYDAVIKATKDAIYDWDVSENELFWGNSFSTVFGYDRKNEPPTIEAWADKIHPDDQERVNKDLSTALDDPNKIVWKFEYRFARADGDYAIVSERGFIIRDEEGHPARMIGALQDITRRKEEENRLKLLESVITNTTDAVIIKEAVPMEASGRKIVYVNDAFTKMTGYKRDEIIGRTTHMFNGPRTDPAERRRIEAAMERWEPCVAELVNYKKSGEEFWVSISLVPVANQDGNYTHWIAIERDITRRKQQEAEMRASLIEKEVLLAEVHHRVKNNLAVVSGMMQLQAFEESSKPFAHKLMNSVTRIKTMAAIHEQLYQSNSFSQLDFSENLEKLVLNIISTMQSQARVKTRFKCKPVELNVNQAIPCALITNEVVTNILKHGFSNQKAGQIEVNLSQKDDRLTLLIADNGNGLPEDFDPDNHSTLGLHLISVLSRQLEADYSFDSTDTGSSFTLRFDVTDSKGTGSAYLQ